MWSYRVVQIIQVCIYKTNFEHKKHTRKKKFSFILNNEKINKWGAKFDLCAFIWMYIHFAHDTNLQFISLI